MWPSFRNTLAKLRPDSNPAQLRIVDPKPSLMRDLPTGSEMATSYDLEKRAGHWALGSSIPVPDLPAEDHLLDDVSLLPPLN